jgi:glycosyltransferase involved in cell wall biosynthesis
MTAVSVIIPCYNQGAFLSEAVESVRAQTYENVEIIIVNDGSDDDETAGICSALEGPGIKVITTSNQGLAAARNKAIEEAGGTYILPLDADDKIAPSYISEAVSVLESDSQIGIVYCRARLFGAVEGDWHLPDYSLEEMLKDNIIFCTALFRRKDWESVGGYDPGMVYGWEDYDFWLALIERGRQVHRLEGCHFFYRVAPESMVRSKEKFQKVEMFKRIFQRHQELFFDHIEVWLEPLLDLREQYLVSRLYVDCGAGVSDESSVARKIELGRRTIKFPIDSFDGRLALRFDPADCPVCIEIETIDLIHESGARSVPISTISSNATVTEGVYLMFSTSDPQIYFNLNENEVKDATELVVTCNPDALGSDALLKIIEVQRRQLKEQHLPFSPFRWFRGDL